MSRIACPTVRTLDQILPDEPLLMMGAGPVPIPAPVAYANSLVINHLGPVMASVLDQVKAMARYVFQTRTPYIVGVAGPGSATMEMAMANLLEPDDKVLAICNGYFSTRMAEMARRVGATVTEHVIDGHRCADGHPAHRDRLRPRGVAQLVAVSVDETVRLRGRCDDYRTGLVQCRGKRPVDEVVIGARAGQQNSGDTAQIDRHVSIVPVRGILDDATRANPPPWLASGNQEVYRGVDW